jgi:hypothetical protein
VDDSAAAAALGGGGSIVFLRAQSRSSQSVPVMEGPLTSYIPA